jgi:nicotinate phosphoribosyltransferase
VRQTSREGVAEAELVGSDVGSAGDREGRNLLAQLVRNGEVVGEEPLQAARDRHQRVRAELPPEALKMSKGEPVIHTVYLNTE